MPPFDAVCNAMATMSAGGFSPHPSSIAGYGLPACEWTIAVFMLLAGGNLALHWRVLTGRPLAHARDPEFRVYVGAAVLLGVLYFVYRRFRLHYGQLFSIWVAWYGLQRFLLDGLRFGMGDAVVGPFTWNQLSGLAAGIGGIVMLVWFSRSQSEATPENDARWHVVREEMTQTAPETD